MRTEAVRCVRSRCRLFTSLSIICIIDSLANVDGTMTTAHCTDLHESSSNLAVELEFFRLEGKK